MYLLKPVEKIQKIQKDTKNIHVSFCIFLYLLIFFPKDTCIFLYLFVSFEPVSKDTKRYLKIHKDTSKNFIVNKNANTHNYSFETFMVLSRLNLCRIRFRFRRINA